MDIPNQAEEVMDQLEDLLLEWEDRRGRGEPASVESLCPDDTALRDDLARRIQLLEAFDALMAPAAGSLPVPERVGKYEVRCPIGAGGMGVVYEGWDPVLARRVAIKMIHPRHLAVAGPQADARFAREGQALAKLGRTNIVAVYEAGVHDRSPYLVMEFVPGGSLATHRRRLTEAGPRVIAPLMEKVARAVQVAHDRGILHRDLKPANILLDGGGEPFVADFGLSALVAAGEPEIGNRAGGDRPTGERSGSLTTDRGAGTPGYMAPEQLDPGSGPVTAATDVWALGVILHELLTGERPVAAGSRELVRSGPEARTRTSPPGAAGRRLLRVARRCLAKDPARRIGSAAQLAEALRRATAPRRWGFAVGAVAVALGVLIGTTASFQTWPFARATWPDLPAVAEARAKLTRGERVVLVDVGKPPTAFHWPRGPESGKVLRRGDGLFTVHSTSSEGCLVELLPDLPPGRYRIDAELHHETANGMSWVGVYGAGSHCRIPRGRQHFFVFARYADVGRFAEETPGANSVTANRRTHLTVAYLGDSDEHPHLSVVDFAPHPDGRLVQAPDRGWRPISLTIDSEMTAATQGQGEPIGFLGINQIEMLRAKALLHFPDLGAAEWPLRMHGGIGLFVLNGTLSVSRFEITPLPSGG
ncbi:MAG: hypothetical protein JWO38_3762 [Gemmataceae bacterium]|nr:hypothetical protein [Gemmataceae bacterium]